MFYIVNDVLHREMMRGIDNTTKNNLLNDGQLNHKEILTSEHPTKDTSWMYLQLSYNKRNNFGGINWINDARRS
jgi:hypothetical protein